MKNKTAKEIVDENFRGLDELIEDVDLRDWYRSLIETCIESYSEQLVFDKDINDALNHTDALDTYNQMSNHQYYNQMSDLIEKLKVSLQNIKKKNK